jgi:hypothetical protein
MHLERAIYQRERERAIYQRERTASTSSSRLVSERSRRATFLASIDTSACIPTSVGAVSRKTKTKGEKIKLSILSIHNKLLVFFFLEVYQLLLLFIVLA